MVSYSVRGVFPKYIRDLGSYDLIWTAEDFDQQKEQTIEDNTKMMYRICFGMIVRETAQLTMVHSAVYESENERDAEYEKILQLLK